VGSLSYNTPYIYIILKFTLIYTCVCLCVTLTRIVLVPHIYYYYRVYLNHLFIIISSRQREEKESPPLRSCKNIQINFTILVLHKHVHGFVMLIIVFARDDNYGITLPVEYIIIYRYTHPQTTMNVII